MMLCVDCNFARLNEFQKYLNRTLNKMAKNVLIAWTLKYNLFLHGLAAVIFLRYSKVAILRVQLCVPSLNPFTSVLATETEKSLLQNQKEKNSAIRFAKGTLYISNISEVRYSDQI